MGHIRVNKTLSAFEHNWFMVIMVVDKRDQQISTIYFLILIKPNSL